MAQLAGRNAKAADPGRDDGLDELRSERALSDESR
jgi:hypothetical protein